MLNTRSKFLLRTVLLALVVPAVSLPATLNLNGANITYPGSVGPVAFNSNVTVNGDLYNISGNYSASYVASGLNIAIFPTVTYLGASPIAQTDVVTISYIQNFTDNSPGSFDGPYSEHIPLMLSGTAAGSFAQGQLSFDGQGLGLVTLNGNGSISQDHAANLVGLTPGNTLIASFDFTYSFASATPPGAVGSSPVVPEPAQLLPMGMGLSGFAILMMRRLRSAAKAA